MSYQFGQPVVPVRDGAVAEKTVQYHADALCTRLQPCRPVQVEIPRSGRFVSVKEDPVEVHERIERVAARSYSGRAAGRSDEVLEAPLVGGRRVVKPEGVSR